MIHITAACFCAGQYWKSGYSVHSSNMYVGWTRRNAAILALVQFHMTGPPPHRVILCSNVSVVRQREHDFCGTRWMAANRKLVGIISCIAVYHVDFIVSGSSAAVTFFHTCCHGSLGYSQMIRISPVPVAIFAIVSNTPYIRCLKAFIVSRGLCVVT